MPSHRVPITLLSLLLITASSSLLFPTPKSLTLHPTITLTLTPCSLILQPQSPLPFDPTYYFSKLLKREFGDQLDLECQALERVPLVLRLDEGLAKERYQIRVEEKQIVLGFATQRGYVYAMETLFQMV
jgi:hypothetical protein